MHVRIESSHKKFFLMMACLFSVMTAGNGAVFADERPTNIIIVFVDDQGYADLSCFGARDWKTPHIDQMAAEGMKLTNFHVTQAVCGASRASLLTGCYANRIGMLGAPNPMSTHGIQGDELLISELCKEQGYVTAALGKWHLGHHREFLPLQHGFDSYFGLPFSNDMWPFHPTVGDRFPPLVMIEGNDVVIDEITPEHQKQLTTWYTERAVKFIEENKERPFFLYVAHAMPHVPLYVSDKFEGKSGVGLYGDVTMEIDWSVGEILKALKNNGIDENTWVIYTSDNGPWLPYGNHGGSAGPLREGKGTAFEGGVRVPCVMKYPKRIPAGGVCDEFAATVDLLPSIAAEIGGKLPEHPIDGKNILPLLSGDPDARTPHEYFCFYWGNELHAITSGDWKLHFDHPYRTLDDKVGKDGKPAGYVPANLSKSLFHLKNDIGETTDVKEQYPEVVKRLEGYAEQARKELGDSLLKRKGTAIRPSAQYEAVPQ